ncbi:mucin-2-like isoform X1 [Macrobrachium rosenbergii]|uniref:mucin-2-like isoform X1 n=1 Tax=Macrobrachium rosenbergii TaxID=79674 RepID=UPI0034D668B6
MVENVVGQCGRAAVTRVASSRVELRACRVRACRGVHVVGVKPCAAPAPCPAHYGLCLPVLVSITDPVNSLGTLQPDKDAILEIVENNKKKYKKTFGGEKVKELETSREQLVKELKESEHFSNNFGENQPSGADVESSALALENWAKGIALGEKSSNSQDFRGAGEQYKEFVGTLAELAAEKRAGRVAPGPEPPTGAPRHHEAVQLFSELMQTDDVSTIAAQIANQAELIYQTWKTTGLNPTELIRYHSVTSDGSLLERGEQAATASHTSPSKPSTTKPRTPVRSISPAPPGSSPAVPRKVLDSSLHNGRAHINSTPYTSSVPHNQVTQNQSPHSQSPHSQSPHSTPPASASPHAASPVRTLNTSPRPYVPPGAAPQSPGAQQQQQPVYPNSNLIQAAPQSPRLSYSSPSSPSLNQGGPRPYVSPAAPQSPRGSSVQPPPPPERSSSYSGVDPSQHPQQQDSPLDILADPGLEASLQELVNSFVIEDKARHHAAAVAALASQRPKSAPSSIQEALQRFERQMAITSRVAAQAADNLSNSSSPISQPNTMGTLGRFSQQQMTSTVSSSSVSMSSSSSSSTNTSMSINTIGRRYGGTRSDSALSNEWTRMQMEHDARNRRSISPNPPVSQPGWNEGPSSNTSTWPLKHKQPSTLEKKTSMQSHSSSTHLSTSSATSSYSSSNVTTSTSTNYITTLEARVESSGGQKFTGVPLRHKVVTMSAVDQEEERLMNALRTGTLIDDGDRLRPLNQTRPVSAPTTSTHTSAHTSTLPTTNSIINSSISNNISQSNATEYPAQARRPKYSISVTVDVDNPTETQNQRVQQQQQQQMQHQQMQKQQVQQSEYRQSSSSVTMRTTQQRVQMKSQVEGDMSAVDFAKVRFQESQQHPHSSQRLDDYRHMSSKQVVSSDGRVMLARTRFENGSTSISDSTWRGTLGIQADEVGSTLPEFYRRKLRKMRKAGSPEPLVAGSISALPHPELTDQQKAHIRERSQSPTTGYNSAGVAIRPFLTQGSVAERVLIFERAPAEMKPKPGAPTSGPPTTEKRRPAISTWRDPNEVRSLAQFWNILNFLGALDDMTEGVVTPVSPPSPIKQIEAPPPSTTTTAIPTTPTTTNAAQDATTAKQLTYVRENSVSTSQKENARPLVSSPPSTPVSSLSPTPQSVTPTAAPPLTHTSPASPVGISATPPAFHSTRPTNTTIRRHTKAAKNLLIPRFYYPMGRPTTQSAQEQAVSRVGSLFREHGGQITRENMEPLMRACQLPLYWKAPLFIAAGGDKLGYLTQEQFCDYWTRVISTCHDMASRFVRVLSRGVRNYLIPEDFLSMIQDVVDTHPGLTFLKEATEFHSRYVHTVIARIYYCVNRSWSGRITVPELRRSNLLQVISYLEEEEDINQITDYFSYEHFYVIYCKFWELDSDHDLFIDKHDLAKHNERSLSWRMIERIFSGAVTRGRLQKLDRMGYQEFVWFLISEEDKRHPTAIEYWFRCMDLDGDGYLSMYELEYFYEEQLQRMEALGIETLPFHDCLCQMLDMVRPEEGDKISLRDLKKCRMTPIFFDTFFNLEKYLDHEQRDPFASHRADDDGPEVSDWDRYAAEEYELLVAEEGGADHQDDVFYGDEDELSMGCDDALDSNTGGGGGKTGVVGNGGALNKHSPLSATVTNLAADPMDVDDDYPDYADSDDYQY